MKKNVFLLPLLAVISLSGCGIKMPETESEKVSETQESKSSNITSTTTSSNSGSTPTSDYSGKYYDNIDSSKSGNALLSELQTLMFSTHKKYCSYGEIRYEFKKSDKDPNKSGNIICFYSHQSINGTWDAGTTYNREHVWPKANSNNLFKSVDNSYSGAGSDLHHVRPAITSINEDRGNQKFGNYIPNDNVKGDCARIIMYLYTHYASSLSGTGSLKATYAGNLSLTSVFTNTNLIKEWNRIDPVDELEKNRNEYCYTHQGNRNPFIDHPEWVEKALG